jgi:GT2 family glycosyltransferase
VPNHLQPSYGTYWDHSHARGIQSATGAVIAIRADAWNALGGFRPIEHMYGEDHDLFWRAQELGFIAWFTPDAEFIHLGGATTTDAYTPPGRARAVALAEAKVIRSHLGPGSAAVAVTALRLGHAARSTVFRLRGEESAAAEQAAFARGFRGVDG